MPTKYTTSTNIIRDTSRDLNYIPTPNGIRVVDQIANDFKKGLRSFNIIGSYGTGKSSFLWALQQSLTSSKKIFKLNLLASPKVEIIKFIGEYKSISSVFADYFNVNQTKHQSENILSEIFNRYHELGKKNPLLVIMIDEFGKYLEYASQNTPEKELFFIQQLSEFANNPDHNIILITTVHQNFDAYAFSLTNSQKQEWTKVKGRFREITFNEPVEQLLFLASEHLKQFSVDKKVESDIKVSLAIAKKSRAFNINHEYASDVASKLFPLDFIAANILTLSLQKYGQNERSLFSFLESTDPTGINSFDKKINPFYNVASVYDYLIFNFYSFINSRYNPDFAAWSAIKSSLEEAERVFDANILDYSKILKTIGLLNITAAAGSDMGKDFLLKYAITCLGIPNANKLIDDLEGRKLILYRNYSKRYILFEGTDLDISTALIAAGEKVSEISDVATLLNRNYQLPPVFAKSYSYLNGTPRLFEYRISEYPISEVPRDEVDGFINLIFNETLDVSEVKKESLKEQEAIIYGFYQNAKIIKNLLFEIETTRKVIEENSHDKVAVKELNNILFHQQNLLNHYILNNLYSKNSGIVWIYKGEPLKLTSKKKFNKQLTTICNLVYNKTPEFKNELVNKHKISSSIHTAKKNYFKALVNNWNQPDLGFDKDKFPPEKTIYITLLKQNGITLYSDEINTTTPQVSKKSSFNHIWKVSVEFLDSAKKSRRKVSDLSELLSKRPFKLKQGLIDFWVASFLFIKRDDFAVFSDKGYIPTINDEILELIIKNPDDYELKAFDIEGVKLDIFNSYRVFLNQHSKEKIDNQTFIETIKPFLTFYRNLSDYSKNTKRLKKETLAIRDAIASSKDPEKSFFEDFPLALGYSSEALLKPTNLQTYTIKLQEAIRELRNSYDSLINRFEEFIIDEFMAEPMDFEEYKAILQNRFKRLKKHLCLPHQKTFIQRLDSQLDDKKAWLNSIAQAAIGKTLENLKDEEEILLYDKFKTIIHELDNLTAISQADIDNEKEEALGIEFSSFVDGINKNLIRLPKTKKKEVLKIEDSIKATLSDDSAINITALATVLKELLQKQ